MAGMVRPERFVRKVESCCIRLAGESPVAVSAGAPRSRSRARSENCSPERDVESPKVTARSLGGKQVGGPNRKVNLAAS
jgi:hypothetical protein